MPCIGYLLLTGNRGDIRYEYDALTNVIVWLVCDLFDRCNVYFQVLFSILEQKYVFIVNFYPARVPCMLDFFSIFVLRICEVSERKV